jgi:thioredoxin reductase (NADPH)
MSSDLTERQPIAAAALHGRYEQAFPTLSESEIERLGRFGTPFHYGDGERLVASGNPVPGMWVVLSGHVAMTARDGMGRVTPVVEHGPGQFLGEVSSLTGHAAALVDGHANGDVDALLITPERLRALMIAEADLGERIMRALVLRRVALINDDRGGPILIGASTHPDVVRLQGFLVRNGQPLLVLDPLINAWAAALVAQHLAGPAELPLVICPNGAMLRNPSESALALALGMLDEAPDLTRYDVAIVGAGPAGLAAAVYAASEGLSVVVLEAQAYGGQAGASARIENYFGFPTGISGHALTSRAFIQANKFGAHIKIPVEVHGLICNSDDGDFRVLIDRGQQLRARSVVVASGARYRRPAIDGLATFEGRGVSYWASPIEARLTIDKEVIVVGGGNSAAQAAVFLSASARNVKMMVRGTSLAESMSSYLIERIRATANIELMTQTEIIALIGDSQLGLQAVRWRDASGAERVEAIQHVFLFVGADPSTSWLLDCGAQLDRAGFVVTGTDARASALESSVRGLFVVGDARSGSVKRVGAAIGEGAEVVAALHQYLAHRANQ